MGERITDLAFKIADDAARADIEIMCKPVGDQADTVDAMRSCWYDLTQPIDPELAPFVAQAVEYLDGRGLLKHHPEHTGWTRPQNAQSS
jgi:hypothetical protein